MQAVEQRSQDGLGDSRNEQSMQGGAHPNEKSTTEIINPAELPVNDILDMIDKLEEHRKICQKTRNFIEAEEAKGRIKELKFEIIVKRRRELDLRHGEEVTQVIESQNIEIEKFNQFWNKKLEEYETEAGNIEQQMLEKHKNDFMMMEEDLRNTVPLKPKTTPQHLNYKKVLDNLAKQGDYVEAHKMKVICENMERDEINKAKDERENKIRFILNQLVTRQQSEIKVLYKRVEAGKNELVKARQQELEKLIHKFQNIRQEIELVQQLEISRFEMAYRNYVPGERALFASPQKKAASKFGLLNNSLVQYTNSGNSLYGDKGVKHKRSASGLGGGRSVNQSKASIGGDSRDRRGASEVRKGK